MIIIDKEAPQKLLPLLEKIKAQSIHARCLFFNLKADAAFATRVAQVLPAIANNHIASEHTQMYVCDDGDTFILSSYIASKDGKDCILAVADAVGRQASDDWVRFLELPLHQNIILYELTAKIEKIVAIQQEKQKQIAEQQIQFKRQAILDNLNVANKADIKRRRQQRSQPELMIIEDDTFSRRLVENTLQKKYSLTGLAEANYALDTYARIAPDLLFLDIDLPNVTGHELLEKIIVLDPDAYVIMLSGNSDKNNITRAMSKGAKGFVAKPFTKEKLMHYIQHCPTIK